MVFILILLMLLAAIRLPGQIRKQKRELPDLPPALALPDCYGGEFFEEFIQNRSPFLCQRRVAVIFLFPRSIAVLANPGVLQRICNCCSERAHRNKRMLAEF